MNANSKHVNLEVTGNVHSHGIKQITSTEYAMRLLPRLSDFLLSASPPAVTSLPQSFASLSTK